MFNIIGWIIIGLIIGVILFWFYLGSQGFGWIGVIVVGIFGLFVGGFIGGMFIKEKDMMKLIFVGFIMLVIGGFVLIFVVKWLGLM